MNDKFVHLEAPYGFKSFYTKYPEGYSIFEALLNWLDEVNKMIDVLNITLEQWETLRDYINTELKGIAEEQLEEWLNDGTLELIVSEYLNKNITLATTLDLLNTPNLKVGTVIKTLGYHTLGDTGGATFVIEDVKPNTFSFKLTNETLWAKLIIQKNMNVLQFGIIGDGVTDVTTRYQEAINNVNLYGDSYLYVPKGTYMIDGVDHNKTPSDTNHLLDAGGIKVPSGMTIEHDPNAIMSIIANNYQAYNLYRIYNVRDVVIRGGVLLGDRDTHFGGYGGEWGYLIAITGGHNITLENLTCKKAWGDGINLQYLFSEASLSHSEKTCSNIYINNVKSDMNRRQGLSIESGEHIVITNSQFTNTNGIAPEFGIDIEPANANSTVNDVVIEDCFFDGNQSRHLGLYASTSDRAITNIYVTRCYFGKCYNSYNYAVSMEANTDYVYFNDNVFDFSRNTGGNEAYLVLLSDEGNYTFKNNVFKDASFYSNNDSNLLFIDNVIETYQATSFFLLDGMGNWVIQNNICLSAKKDFLLYTSIVSGSLYFLNNVLSFSEGNIQVLRLDNSPDVTVFALNNILNGEKIVMTWIPIKSNQMISQGAFAGLSTETNRPLKANRGTICYETNSGKPIFYTGTKWIFADGTDA